MAAAISAMNFPSGPFFRRPRFASGTERKSPKVSLLIASHLGLGYLP